MFKISVVDGHHQPQTRPTKNGLRHFQTAYAHLGGAFPAEIEIPLRGPADAKPVGDYTLDLSTYQVGRFKNLELNPFELKLSPVQKPLSKAL